jgi:hypothetical protein
MRCTRCQACHTERNNAIRLPLRAPRRLAAARRQPLGPCARPERCLLSSDGNALRGCNRNATQHVSEFPNGYGALRRFRPSRLHTFMCTTALFSMHPSGEWADARSRGHGHLRGLIRMRLALSVLTGRCSTRAPPDLVVTLGIAARRLHGLRVPGCTKTRARKPLHRGPLFAVALGRAPRESKQEAKVHPQSNYDANGGRSAPARGRVRGGLPWIRSSVVPSEERSSSRT